MKLSFLNCTFGVNCERKLYKFRFCKKHFLEYVKQRVRRELKVVYRDPESAYAALDFSGCGKIQMQSILSNLVIKRLKIDDEDIRHWLLMDKIFQDDRDEIDFGTFKKSFFPQLCQIDEYEESDPIQKTMSSNTHKQVSLSLKRQQNREEQSPLPYLTEELKQQNDQEQKELLLQKLKTLESKMKLKFANNWISVRRAFLDLDYDHDGYITGEDIMRFFGALNKEIDLNDLMKLIKEKDSQKKGKLSYADFSKWMGVVIHQSEGFYFRHDSIKNPQYEQNLQKYKTKESFNQKVVKQTIDKDFEKTIVNKIQFQWKTLKKAFIDLNKDKSGAITSDELKIYLVNWGITLNDEQFKYIFDKFDNDKDGKISYEDFQNTVGMEINPMEHLYFRQDVKRIPKPITCKKDKCWQPPSGLGGYCIMHSKIFKNKGLKIISAIQEQLGYKWPQFIKNLQRSADKDDPYTIFLEDFVSLLKNLYQIEINQTQKEEIYKAFPAKSEDNKLKINIAYVYTIKNTQQISRIYKKLDLNEEEEEDQNFVDTSGYFGQFYRKAVNLEKIPQEEFVQVILKDNRLANIMRCVKEIDKDNNGYVTNQELDDIFKMVYPEEFGNKDLKRLFRNFSSIQNRILIDYKKLRNFLLNQLKVNNTQRNFKKDSQTQQVQTSGQATIEKIQNSSDKKVVIDLKPLSIVKEQSQQQKVKINQYKKKKRINSSSLGDSQKILDSVIREELSNEDQNEYKDDEKELLLRRELEMQLGEQSAQHKKSRDMTPLRTIQTCHSKVRSKKGSIYDQIFPPQISIGVQNQYLPNQYSNHKNIQLLNHSVMTSKNYQSKLQQSTGGASNDSQLYYTQQSPINQQLSPSNLALQKLRIITQTAAKQYRDGYKFNTLENDYYSKLMSHTPINNLKTSQIGIHKQNTLQLNNSELEVLKRVTTGSLENRKNSNQNINNSNNISQNNNRSRTQLTNILMQSSHKDQEEYMSLQNQQSSSTSKKKVRSIIKNFQSRGTTKLEEKYKNDLNQQKLQYSQNYYEKHQKAVNGIFNTSINGGGSNNISTVIQEIKTNKNDTIKELKKALEIKRSSLSSNVSSFPLKLENNIYKQQSHNTQDKSYIEQPKHYKKLNKMNLQSRFGGIGIGEQRPITSSIGSHYNEGATLSSQIKQKLAYEWKNIYRTLSLLETHSHGQGRVTFKEFEQVLNKLKVCLTKEELATINKKFEDVGYPETINYCKLSKSLGLHNNFLELIRPSTSIIQE